MYDISSITMAIRRHNILIINLFLSLFPICFNNLKGYICICSLILFCFFSIALYLTFLSNNFLGLTINSHSCNSHNTRLYKISNIKHLTQNNYQNTSIFFHWGVIFLETKCGCTFYNQYEFLTSLLCVFNTVLTLRTLLKTNYVMSKTAKHKDKLQHPDNFNIFEEQDKRLID